MNYVTGTLPKKAADDLKNMTELFAYASETPLLKEFINNNAELINELPLLLGSFKNESEHAGAVILTPSQDENGKSMEIYDWIPVKKNKDGVLVSEYTGSELDSLGFLKNDFLGLSQLDKVKAIIKLIEEDTGEKLEIDKLPLDDKKTYWMFQEGYTKDIFQFNGDGITGFLMDLMPDTIHDLIAANALYRPGAMNVDGHTKYARVKNGIDVVNYMWGTEEITKTTYGILCYQEQIMKLCSEKAGFTMSESDSIRKCLHGDTLMWTNNGYKKISEMAKLEGVLTFSTAEKENKINRTKNVFCSGEKDCITVKFDSGREITLTPDHKVYTNYGWMKSKDLLKKDNVFCLHELEEKYGNIEHDLSKIHLTIALITEGSLSNKNAITFVNKDLNEINDFVFHYEKYFKKPVKQIVKDKKGVYCVRLEGDCVEELGLKYCKSDGHELPDYFLSLNKNQLEYSVAKLIDFDGYASYKTGSFFYCSKSKKLIDQIHFMIECLGVKCTMTTKYLKKYKSNYYEINITNKYSATKLYDAIKNYSNKAKDFDINILDVKISHFSKFIVPHNIFFPIITNLVKNSGYKTNEILSGKISGTFFKKNITTERIDRMLKVTGRSKLLEFFVDKKSYWDKPVEIKKAGKHKVYDFTMSSHVTPQAYANGILVHNCIGKKMDKELAEYEPKFKEGMIANGCPKDEVGEIWDTLVGFGQYSFNSSHASAYTLLSYATMYFKAHYPLQFYTVALQFADDDTKPKIINEMNHLGEVIVVQPDINGSNHSFTPDKNKNKIYWSLSSIKWVGDKAVDKIIKEREKGGNFFSLEDFIDRVDKRTVNKRSVNNLILAGAFDEIYNVKRESDRGAILKEYYTNILNIDIPETYANQWQDHFFVIQAIELTGLGYIDYKHLISNSSFKAKADLLLNPIRFQQEESIDSEVIAAGLISKKVERNTKKGKMLSIDLNYNGEEINVTMWNETYAENKKLFKDYTNEIIMLNGIVRFDGWKKKNVIHTTDKTKIELI